MKFGFREAGGKSNDRPEFKPVAFLGLLAFQDAGEFSTPARQPTIRPSGKCTEFV